MDAPRTVLLILLLFFLFLSPDTRPPTPSQQYELQHLIAKERHAVALLNSSHYGDLDVAKNRWINVTGLREEDGYAWNLLPKFQERAEEQYNTIVRSWRDVVSSGALGEVAESSSESANTSELDIRKGLHLPFYQNVTGIVRGHWVRSRVGHGFEPPILNVTALAPHIPYAGNEFTRNISGHGGDLRIKLDEKKSETLQSDQGSIREIRAEMTIRDTTSSGDGWEMTLHGVHFPELGQVLLSTTGEKFTGIFALPQFARSDHTFALAKQLLNRTLTAAILRQESSLFTSPSFPWSSSPNSASELLFPTAQCEYIVYLQQHPLEMHSGASVEKDQLQSLKFLEQELRYPTGASLQAVPPLTMSAIIFSPDCGFVLESKGPPDFASQDGLHLKGPKLESYLGLVKRCIVAFAVIVSLQITLVMRQMKDASTPSTRSRVSFYTIAIMAMGDGFVCMGFQVVGMFIDAAFLLLISTAFLAFLCVSFFGMKFLMDIWTVQAPERQERERRNAASNPPQRTANTGTTPVVVITPAGADTLPLPVTARRPADTGATPIILPPDQDLVAAENEDAAAQTTQTTLGSARREMGALYSKFYVLLLAILFLSLHATTWPTMLRSIYTNMLAFSYLSFWAPQIYRNVVRNCRKAFRWEFVIGQSILRLTPIVYFYTIKENILFVEPDTNAALVLVGWVWIQICALLSQEILGPRFFIPIGWAPPAYDYHPVLREDDDEESGATMPIGFTQATSDSNGSSAITPGESTQSGQKTFDCAICMQNIDVPVVPSGAGDEGGTSIGTNLFSRRAYMVTPCRHIFHSACLEGWMRYRLQCPICRENLPPL